MVALVKCLGGRATMPRTLYREPRIHIDQEELAQFLGMNPGGSGQ